MSGTEQAVADPPVLWGEVSAAHQVEDGNVASDNWASEHPVLISAGAER